MSRTPKFLSAHGRPDLWCVKCGVIRLSMENVDGVCDTCNYSPGVISIGIETRDSMQAKLGAYFLNEYYLTAKCAARGQCK